MIINDVINLIEEASALGKLAVNAGAGLAAGLAAVPVSTAYLASAFNPKKFIERQAHKVTNPVMGMLHLDPSRLASNYSNYINKAYK